MNYREFLSWVFAENDSETVRPAPAAVESEPPFAAAESGSDVVISPPADVHYFRNGIRNESGMGSCPPSTAQMERTPPAAAQNEPGIYVASRRGRIYVFESSDFLL